MEIKNLVFDMGNVLIKFEPQRYLEAFVSDKSHRELLMQEVFRGLEWISADCGMPLEQAVKLCLEHVPEELHEYVRMLFMDWHKEMQIIEGMEELIRAAKAKGYGIYLLSNTSESYYSYRERLPAIELFDGEFASCDWHLMKPSESIYRAFYHQFRLVPAQCLFIDDSAANILGANKTGMDGIVFHGKVNDLVKQLKAKGVDLLVY